MERAKKKSAKQQSSSSSNKIDERVEGIKVLKKTIEDLTHSGRQYLEASGLKAVLERSKDKILLPVIYDELIKHLGKDHSEVRFSTVQLIDELFLECKPFRDRLIGDVHVFIDQTMNIRMNSPLPPPKVAAQQLVKLAITTLDKWYRTFFDALPELRLIRAYLEENYVDFKAVEIIDPKVKAEREEKERTLKKINGERLKNFNKTMEELMPEIHQTGEALKSCFQLLLPSPENFTDGPSGSATEDQDPDLRAHGVIDPLFKMEINLGNKVQVKEDEDNGSILEAARDSFNVINRRFLPKVIAWIELISAADGEKLLMKKATGLKKDLESLLIQYNRLEVVPRGPVEDDFDEVSSDSDLEEVEIPKPERKALTEEEISFLTSVLDQKKAKSIKPRKSSIETKDEPPAKDEGSNRKTQLLKVAPVLPYDIDLYHWEDEKLPTPTLIPVNPEGASFWAASSDDMTELPAPGGSASLRSRVIEFSGKWEPVTRACKAPLESGKLCPRHDRVKCPFHGVIVDRNDEGEIINPEDVEKVKASISTVPKVPEWQDPKLLAEIKAATGIDLKMPEKGKRLKKSQQKHPGLTDLNPVKDTPITRIARKIFNKGALKRVAASLDKIDQKRFRDKFADQFNYTHDTA